MTNCPAQHSHSVNADVCTCGLRVRVCRLCYDYAAEGALVVPDARARDGWRHAKGTVRCAGQEDDDTDDRAEPMWLGREDAAYFGIIEEPREPPLEN